jgi:YbbR domain-containing protein
MLFEPLTSRTTRVRWRRFWEQVNTLGLSIVLALIVWLIAINQENPIVQATYPERLPVTVRGLPETLQPLQDLSRETVQVVLQAPRVSWDSLDVSDFIAYIDLTGLGPGVHDVDVRVEVLDARVQVVSVERDALRVQLDEVIAKPVPVRVEIMDSSAFGYDWQPPLIEPMTVTVTGPSTQVEQVTTARAEVYLRNAKSQVERSQPVSLLNGQGQIVPRVTPEPSTVHIVVPVEQWPGRKEVAVRVNLTGQPAAGYRLSTVRVNPSTVVLLGSTDVLTEVPGFVETEEVSLTDATREIERRLQLRVPDNVTVLEGTSVDVTATITPIEGGTTVRQHPIIQGLAPGLEATVSLDTVDVILSGPLPLLESLGPDDVFVILDLEGLLPGNHIVTPRVVVPPGISAGGVLPASVEVVITYPAPATPSVVITPTTPITPASPLPQPTLTPTATPSSRE